jgi:Rrf2 family protein
MIRISTKGRYGTRFMLQLAINYANGPMLLKEIAQIEEISEGYLQHIVDALKNVGLIHSNRVGHGGYILAKPPSEITLREILNALEGRISFVECVDKPDICGRANDCVTRDIWEELGEKFSASLRSITLENMVEKSKHKQNKYLSYDI